MASPSLQSIYAVVLAGGRGTRLRQLTNHRAKPAMPFAGNLKIIDFTLSNCVNSGIRRIGVLTQYKSQSLVRHITRGWGFLDAGLGEFVDVIPAQQQIDSGWYSGTANAVFQNLRMLRDIAPQHVLVLAGDHVYKMDYRHLIADHLRLGADVTVACNEVPIGRASAFGVVGTDAHGRITAFDEKPAHPCAAPGRADAALASMGVYVFNAAFLYRELERDASDPLSCHDFGHDIIPAALARGRVCAHDFASSCVNTVGSRPYWRDVGTLQAYWEANMELTRPQPELNLDDDQWPVRSLQLHLPSARLVAGEDGHHGTVIDSLVSSGCVVRGASVRRSLLFSKVRVGNGSDIEDSLLLPGVVVGRNVVLRRAIVDEHCVLPDGIKIGVHPAEDSGRFTVTDSGLTLVTPDMLY